MSELNIKFSPRAKQRLEDITDFLLEQTGSKTFVINFINSLKEYLYKILGMFPEAGTPMLEYGIDIRRVVFKEYSFLYQIKGSEIHILTVYKENLP